MQNNSKEMMQNAIKIKVNIFSQLIKYSSIL